MNGLFKSGGCNSKTHWVFYRISRLQLVTISHAYLPILWPSGPNKLVPIRYDILAGRNTAPCCHLGECIVSIMWSGNDGSNIAIPILANVIAPLN